MTEQSHLKLAESLSPAYPGKAPWGTANKLRAWQQEAMEEYFRQDKDTFLVSATPGAGKTNFALSLARELLQRQLVNRIVVVAPTEHLKYQWADAASRMSIRLNPEFSNNSEISRSNFHGVVVTYAQVAVQPWRHEKYTSEAKTLVIFDEIHHAGDSLSWGTALYEAYESAERRLLLTGTPFRSDNNPIPFVEYTNDSESHISTTDFSYSYPRALSDGVVRPVIFLSYAGKMRWKTRSGDDFTAHLGHADLAEIQQQAWRTALDPKGEWIQHVLKAADRRLTEIRQYFPEAGALLIAANQTVARAYAKILHQITGESITVVISDEANSSDKIAKYSDSNDRWIVAVKMVSEGVDIPRLMVGVYASNASTPLYFTQAIGRFVRARRKGETATIFLPSVPSLQNLAAEIERERDHVFPIAPEAELILLDEIDREVMQRDDAESAAAERVDYEFEAVSSLAEFDKAIFSGENFGQAAAAESLEEEEFIGLPGLLEPEQIKTLLQHREYRQKKLSRRAKPIGTTENNEPVPLYRSLKEQRQLLKTLVNRYARSTGQQHAHVYADLRRSCGGPEVAKATVEQLQQRIVLLSKQISKL